MSWVFSKNHGNGANAERYIFGRLFLDQSFPKTPPMFGIGNLTVIFLTVPFIQPSRAENRSHHPCAKVNGVQVLYSTQYMPLTGHLARGIHRAPKIREPSCGTIRFIRSIRTIRAIRLQRGKVFKKTKWPLLLRDWGDWEMIQMYESVFGLRCKGTCGTGVTSSNVPLLAGADAAPAVRTPFNG